MTMQQSDRINELIPKLPARARTAFAIACFERTLPFVTWSFGPNEAEPVRHAMDLCWDYAESGIEARPEVEAAIAHFAALADELYEDDQAGSPYLFATNALYWALQSIITPEAKAAQNAANSASDAAFGGEQGNLQEANVDEEMSWQLRALQVAQAVPPDRKMFQSLATKPNWLVRFESRVPPRPQGQ
jgi:hypothetical protein